MTRAQKRGGLLPASQSQTVTPIMRTHTQPDGEHFTTKWSARFATPHNLDTPNQKKPIPHGIGFFVSRAVTHRPHNSAAV